MKNKLEENERKKIMNERKKDWNSKTNNERGEEKEWNFKLSVKDKRHTLLSLAICYSTVTGQTGPCEPCDSSKCPLVIIFDPQTHTYLFLILFFFLWNHYF